MPTLQPLPTLLDEFCAALQDEIDVAKRNSSNSALPLSNGQRVSQQGSAYQYAFQIDTVLNTPDGAPGDLIVPGRAPMEATVVSAEGLRLVISVETDLGKFVPTARLQTNLAFLMRKLIERIERNASVSNPAASRMLGLATVSGSPKKPQGKLSLNDGQMRALQSALGRNLTVIWGPPGTGKTRTIGTIAEQLHKSARTEGIWGRVYIFNLNFTKNQPTLAYWVAGFSWRAWRSWRENILGGGVSRARNRGGDPHRIARPAA